MWKGSLGGESAQAGKLGRVPMVGESGRGPRCGEGVPVGGREGAKAQG